eukprot:m51a1_g8708 hypothetical protein (76) ;mRNA; f:119535-119762
MHSHVVVLSMAIAGPVVQDHAAAQAKHVFESPDGLKTARSHSSLFSEVHQLQTTFLLVCANLVQGKLQPTLGVNH